MGLHPALARIRRNLPAVARSLGFQARVTSGYRSRAAQTKLYNRYLAGLQSYPVAPPGTSDHEKGLALDVVSTNPDKLVALLTEVGLFWAGPDDPVHFSLVSHQAQPTAISGQTSSGGSGFSLPSWLSFLLPLPLALAKRDPSGSMQRTADSIVSAIFDDQ